MKIIGTFGVVVIASIALLQTAEGRGRAGGGSFGGGRSFSGGHSFSSGSRSFSGGSRSYSSGNGAYRSSQRYSSNPSSRHRAYSPNASRHSSAKAAALRNRSPQARVAGNRTGDIDRRARVDSNGRVAANRTSAVRAQRLANGTRLEGQQARNWNRNRDYNWNGNRCRWRNNCWVVIGPWYPWGWGYGYYPYASYGYYDGGYYDDRYYDDSYGQYDDGTVDVSQVQSALARAGYYDGAIDGSFGPMTRSALRRFQQDRGLGVTGQIDRSVVDALRLRYSAR